MNSEGARRRHATGAGLAAGDGSTDAPDLDAMAADAAAAVVAAAAAAVGSGGVVHHNAACSCTCMPHNHDAAPSNVRSDAAVVAAESDGIDGVESASRNIATPSGGSGATYSDGDLHGDSWACVANPPVDGIADHVSNGNGDATHRNGMTVVQGSAPPPSSPSPSPSPLSLPPQNEERTVGTGDVDMTNVPRGQGEMGGSSDGRDNGGDAKQQEPRVEEQALGEARDVMREEHATPTATHGEATATAASADSVTGTASGATRDREEENMDGALGDTGGDSGVSVGEVMDGSATMQGQHQHDGLQRQQRQQPPPLQEQKGQSHQHHDGEYGNFRHDQIHHQHQHDQQQHQQLQDKHQLQEETQQQHEAVEPGHDDQHDANPDHGSISGGHYPLYHHQLLHHQPQRHHHQHNLSQHPSHHDHHPADESVGVPISSEIGIFAASASELVSTSSVASLMCRTKIATQIKKLRA